jgi:prephenate dehydratase
VTLSSRYIQDRFLPDKAIDVIDEAGARTRVHKMALPPELAAADEELADVRERKAAAAAAQEVAGGEDLTVVAIAAPGAADLYGLEVLQANVSQCEANQTRFYVVAREANELEGYGCAVYVADIAAGELPGGLEEVCTGGTELACVHDRPEGSALGTYRYVIELERADGFTDEELARLEGIGQLAYLGCYARVEV